MESNSVIPLSFLLLAILLPEAKIPFFILSAISAIIPFYLIETRRLKFDKLTTKLLLRLSSISNFSESTIAEEVSKFSGYEMVLPIFERTGKLKFPNYGRRSENLANILRLVLQTGRKEILTHATENAINMDTSESELQGLISSEKYNLIFSSITLGAILAVINNMNASPFFLYYVIFQALLASLWLYFISDKFVESFSFLFPTITVVFFLVSVLT